MNRERFGLVDLSRAANAWDTSEQLAERLDQADKFHQSNNGGASTPRLVDARQAAGQRPYICAMQAIGVALDHQRALRSLVEIGISVHAPWTLLRPVYEAPVWALWMLEPVDSSTRRLRGLRREVLDHEESRKFENAFEVPPEYRKQRRALYEASAASYEQDCDALGVTWEQVKRQPLNMIDEIKKLDAIKRQFDGNVGLAEGLWRALSGHVHGYSYAVQLSSVVERASDVPGGSSRTVTLNEGMFTNIALIATGLLNAAMLLYYERSTQAIASV